jgi:dipeptidyl-peptidase-4
MCIRDSTRGDYWVLDQNTKKVQQIGKSLKESSLMFAKFSPNGEKVAYVSEQNIYLEDIESGEMIALTEDGGGPIINGTFDWVYEEEFSLRDGFRWSPDCKKIAFWQMDTEGVGTFYMINNIDSIYPQLIPIPYPKVGTLNSAAKIGVIDTETKNITWMQTSGDPRNNYLVQMDWAASPDELIIQQLNREQNLNKVYFANALTGHTAVRYSEKSDTWLDVYTGMTWLDNGEKFTWRSDQSGWLHLYQISRDGKGIKAITKGDFEVIELLNMDQKGGWIYYIASPYNATQRYLYRSKLNGKDQPERLTPDHLAGHHSYHLSPDCKYAIHTFSNHNTPPQIDLIALPNHKTLRVLEENKRVKNVLTSYEVPEKEFFNITIEGGHELDAWMLKPLDFDAGKKYPVIFYVYGEPFGSTVQDRWNGDKYHEFMAQQGYIIMSIDNRGTKTPKGRDWLKCVYQKIGILTPIEQAACARQIMKWEFVDSERIGIWGWSGGGSNTLHAMFKYPDIYQTGIAVAFISHQKLYDTAYQERYMNLPENNEEGYRLGSPITHAKNLEGNLLLIHGSADDNCHYQSCQLLVDELIKHNKYFTMIDYPMRSHGIYERENTSLHLRMTMYNYWLKHMQPGGITK